MQVLAEPFEDITFLARGYFPFDFIQREVNDVVMMNFLAGEFIGQFQPDAVEQINFFWC